LLPCERFTFPRYNQLRIKRENANMGIMDRQTLTMRQGNEGKENNQLRTSIKKRRCELGLKSIWCLYTHIREMILDNELRVSWVSQNIAKNIYRPIDISVFSAVQLLGVYKMRSKFLY